MIKDKKNDMVIFYPYKEDCDTYVIPLKKEELELCEQGLPVPPMDLWLGYGSKSEEYLSWGKIQVNTLIDILKTSGFELRSKKILDLGCGAGRMVRWFKPYTDTCEVWGTDISSEHIYWANNYLKPPFNFATTTTIPHLPFEDRFFDLIYAGSVFTHIDDLTESWLLELKRVISVEGRIFITIHDRHTLELLDERPYWKESMLNNYLKSNQLFLDNIDKFAIFVGMRGPDSQVIYDLDYFCDSLKNIFEVISIHPEAYGYQTGILLKRK